MLMYGWMALTFTVMYCIVSDESDGLFCCYYSRGRFQTFTVALRRK
jgi:hypothetical protein